MAEQAAQEQEWADYGGKPPSRKAWDELIDARYQANAAAVKAQQEVRELRAEIERLKTFPYEVAPAGTQDMYDTVVAENTVLREELERVKGDWRKSR